MISYHHHHQVPSIYVLDFFYLTTNSIVKNIAQAYKKHDRNALKTEILYHDKTAWLICLFLVARCINARYVLPWQMDFAQYEMLLTENVEQHEPNYEDTAVHIYNVATMYRYTGLFDCSLMAYTFFLFILCSDFDIDNCVTSNAGKENKCTFISFIF
ncbi:hypothetical protein ACJX0J_028976 [Zea mays]